MSHPRIGRSATPLNIDRTRPRQTIRPANPFKDVLRGGANILLSGASAVTRVVGLPSLSAAISERSARRAPLTGDTRLAGTASGPGGAPTGIGDPGLDEDLKLLALQNEIQRHNRQVSLVSNVMKARHDTAKAAISNMRS